MIKSLVSKRTILYAPCFLRSFNIMSSTLSQDEVAGMRIDYKVSNIEDDVPTKDPFEWFNLWFKDATDHPNVEEPNAMNIATATKDGQVSARMVLLKGVTDQGFRFFTNSGSQKGKQLMENPYAALTFYWEPLQRQIRINGRVEKLSEDESTKYFHSRPFGSQIGALVSDQSVVIPNREYLEKKRVTLTEKYEGQVVPKPDYWGGYLVIPDSFEFWCGGSGRLHDRMRFRRLNEGESLDMTLTQHGDSGWIYERLSP